jgi:hypothetical protein
VNLGDTGLIRLTEGLSSGGVLSNLNISKNEITWTGIAVLAEALTTSPIKSLHLSENPIGNKGVMELAKPLT